MVMIDIDHWAPHAEECGFWHGWPCNCNDESRAALARWHCHECDYVNGSGYNPCNCRGTCICDREPGCPCIEHELLQRLAAALLQAKRRRRKLAKAEARFVREVEAAKERFGYDIAAAARRWAAAREEHR